MTSVGFSGLPQIATAQLHQEPSRHDSSRSPKRKLKIPKLDFSSLQVSREHCPEPGALTPDSPVPQAPRPTAQGGTAGITAKRVRLSKTREEHMQDLITKQQKRLTEGDSPNEAHSSPWFSAEELDAVFRTFQVQDCE